LTRLSQSQSGCLCTFVNSKNTDSK